MKRQVKLLYCIGRRRDYKEFKVSIDTLNTLYDNSEYELCVYYRKDVVTIEDKYLECIDDLIKFDIEMPTSFYDKVYCIKDCKYPYFLWVDCDTLFVNKIDDVFNLLDKFELGVAVAPRDQKHKLESVPDSFAEFQAGVILFKRTPAVNKFIESWSEKYKLHISQFDKVPGGDQPSFRECLYHSDVRFYVLDHSYNCKYNDNIYIRGKIKILHGREIEKTELLEQTKLNNKKMNNRPWIKA